MAKQRKLYESFQKSSRQRRKQIFRKHFLLDSETKILDLGGSDGTHIAGILEGTEVSPRNVYLADIRQPLVRSGHMKYGFQPVLMVESEELDFPDHFFDIVFCNSVIEHVTVPKKEIWRVRSAHEFTERASTSQQHFADSIRRYGKGYWVQTPNKWFPIESHTFLPFAGYLPRPILLRILPITNRIWIKRTSPDWHLLTRGKLQSLFPDAEIIGERFAGLTKSIIAVKSR